MTAAQAPLRLAPPADALATLLALVSGPVAPHRIPAAAAAGRVLAEALVAARPVPAAPIAVRDGWAVASAGTAGAGPYAPSPLPVAPAWVEIGETLPAGADAVLTPFEVEAAGPFVAALATAAPGDGARAAGEEAAAGLVLRAAGERLRLMDLLALATLGVEAVMVRAPRVALLPIGDELMAVEATPDRNVLPVVLAALAAREGADAERRAPVGDDPAAIGAALHGAAAEADLVLAVGGTGEGRRDHSPAGLAEAGRVLLHGVGCRPGTTAALGEAGGRPVVLLPGRAEDALAAWWLLARPALRRLAGAGDPPPRSARLARKVASAVGVAELVPLRILSTGLAEPLAVGALPVSALSAADALLVVPPGAEGYEAGAAIRAMGL